MVTTLSLCTLSVLLVLGVHYEALNLISKLTPKLNITSRAKVAVSILLCVTAHFLEIIIFAGVLLLAQSLEIGSLSVSGTGFSEHIYFSLVTYTSLGYGDITPSGALKLLAGVESLIGLVLISWTASFTFLQMRKFW